MFSSMGGRQKDSTTTFLDGILTRAGSTSFSLFPSVFHFPLFLCVLLKVSPQSFSGDFQVIQATFQSNSKRSSQIVNVPVK